MAIKTFVTGSSTATIADNDTTIVGGTAGNEKVKILSGVTGTSLDGNIEKVDLAGSLADYKFVFVAGTGFQVQTVAGAVVTTIASLNQAATVAFADGSAQLTQTGNASVTLGNQTIGTTLVATTATALGATFDTTLKSTVNPTATAGAGQTFTLTTSSDISGVITGSAATTGIDGNDIFTATDTTYNSGDIINGGGGTDVLNLTLAGTQSGNATVVSIETFNVNATTFAVPTYTATNVASSNGSTINVNNTQIGGSSSFTLAGVGTGFTVAAGSAIVGTLQVTTTAATAQTLTLSANTATTQTVVLTGTSGTTDSATVAAAGTVGLNTAGTAQIETVNLSGNGAAATYGITGAATTYNLTGSQSVTLTGDEASFDGKTLNDNTTAGTTTLKLTTLNNSDLSKVRADVINLATDPASDTYYFANGQSVILTAAVPSADFTVDIDDQTTAYTNGSITVELANVVSSAVTAFASGFGIVVAATSATSDNISTLNIVNNTIHKRRIKWADFLQQNQTY
jgi:hypothetical protein